MADFHDFLIEIAELKVRLLCDYPYAKRLCADFEIEGAAPDIEARVRPEEIDIEEGQHGDVVFTKGYCEGACLYRAIAEQLPALNGFVFHGAAVEIDGKGVIFTAPSGTGKSTHISLLMKNYPDKVRIINGDKPIIRKVDGEWRVFGTPWAGKEGWKRNASAPLSAIVIVNRSADNKIEAIEPGEHFDHIVSQVYLPYKGDATLLTFDMLDDISRSVRFYSLYCNMDDSAAQTSYNELK